MSPSTTLRGKYHKRNQQYQSPVQSVGTGIGCLVGILYAGLEVVEEAKEKGAVHPTLDTLRSCKWLGWWSWGWHAIVANFTDQHQRPPEGQISCFCEILEGAHALSCFLSSLDPWIRDLKSWDSSRIESLEMRCLFLPPVGSVSCWNTGDMLNKNHMKPMQSRGSMYWAKRKWVIGCE